MWFYHEEDHTIHSISHYDSHAVLFEGFNRNIIVYKNVRNHRQHFSFDKNKEIWINDYSGDTLGLENDNYRAGASIEAKTQDNDDKHTDVVWKMEYCEKPSQEIEKKIQKAIGLEKEE